MIKDRNVLTAINSMILDALTFARQNRPNENNLPLKDKTLSPRKKKMKPDKCSRFSKTRLPLRTDKKRKKKHFGIGADNRTKASNITIPKESPVTENERSNKPTIIDLRDLVDDQLKDKSPP